MLRQRLRLSVARNRILEVELRKTLEFLTGELVAADRRALVADVLDRVARKERLDLRALRVESLKKARAEKGKKGKRKRRRLLAGEKAKEAKRLKRMYEGTDRGSNHAIAKHLKVDHRLMPILLGQKKQ